MFLEELRSQDSCLGFLEIFPQALRDLLTWLQPWTKFQQNLNWKPILQRITLFFIHHWKFTHCCLCSVEAGRALGAIRSSHSPLKPVVLTVVRLSHRTHCPSIMAEIVSLRFTNSVYTVSHGLKTTWCLLLLYFFGLSFLFFLSFFFFLLKAECLYRLASSSQTSTCLCLLSAGIKCACHHTWLPMVFDCGSDRFFPLYIYVQDGEVTTETSVGLSL